MASPTGPHSARVAPGAQDDPGASHGLREPEDRRAAWRARGLHAFAFLSGAAALAYQVSWTRLLSLTFGSSTLAASATVAAFMGGMGVGAWLYHRAQARFDSPLRIYAVLELGIALCALAGTPLLAALPPWFASAAAALPEGPWMTALRITSVIALLLLPTALMGATYPALCTAAIATRAGLDRHLGALYGWNTLGAACGALAAGLFAIPELGLRGTVGVGVAVNGLVALSAAVLARGGGRASARPAALGRAGLGSALPTSVTAAVLVLSGFATLAYEIVWFRALRYLVGNSTYAFTIILVVFLLGLGLGALALRRVLERGLPERTLAFSQLGIALFAALAIGVVVRLVGGDAGYAISMFNESFSALDWRLRLLVHGGLALALMLPATLLMGLSFPLASRLFIGDLDQLGRRVGIATLLANLGSIAGSIAAATLLLPQLGSLGSTRLLVALNLGLGMFVLAAAPGARLRGLRLAGVLAALALGALVGLPARMNFAGGALAGIEARRIFEEEGDLATVQVSEGVLDPSLRGITIDGTTIGVSPGWSYSVYSKQILIAHLPLVLEPRIRSVVQIGLGSASTLEALTSHESLEHIEAVEISAAVVRGSRFFDASRALEDPRVELFVEDAIHHLLRMQGTVDLIVSDGKQNEDYSGNARMLSHELYSLARDRLSDHGLFVQWLGVAMHDESFPVALRTAAEVFPYLDVFFELPTSVMLIGGKQPLASRASISPTEYLQTRASKDLSALGLLSRDVLRYAWIADRDSLIQLLGPGPVNDWNRAPIEFDAYRADRSVPRHAAAHNLALLVDANALARGRAPRGFVPRNPLRQGSIALVREAYVALFAGDPEQARALVERALALRPADPIALRAKFRLRDREALRAAGDAGKRTSGAGRSISSDDPPNPAAAPGSSRPG